jgi:hypothetical protein
MARPSSDEPLVRAHVWLFASDVEWMRQTFGATLGTSQVIRALVRRTRKEIETKVDANGKPLAQVSLKVQGSPQNEPTPDSTANTTVNPAVDTAE